MSYNAKRLPLLVALLLSLTLVAAACGSSDETVDGAAESNEQSDVADTGEDEDESSDDHDDADHDDADEPSVGVDVGNFFDGALTTDPVTVDCTLASGAETTCLEITVAGYPATRDIGPFCPSTTDADAEEGGIWLDGENLYVLDGEFILSLAEIYDDPNWKLYNDDGTVRVTETQESFVAAIEGAFGSDVDPNNQNVCIEGRIEWVNGGEAVPVTVMVPAEPTIAAEPTTAGATVGVTLDGVRIEGGAPVDVILGAYTIAAFDDCGGHINPQDGYHMHATTGCSASEDAAADGDAALFGYALDGFGIYGPLDADELAAADLDACNGHTSDELGYHYHANQPEENGVLSCFSGEVTADAAGGGGPGGGGPPPGGGGGG